MAQCSICGKAHTEIGHAISSLQKCMPSTVISSASTEALGAFRRTQIDSLLRSLKRAGTEVYALALDPVGFASVYVPGLKQILAIAQPKEAKKAMTTLKTDIETEFENSDNQSLKRFLLVAALSAEVEAATSSPVATADEADALRVSIVAEIDALLLDVRDDDSFSALMDLKASASAALIELKKQARRTTTTTIQQGANSLAVAYRIYGDASRTDEFCERNAIRNPALVSGGTVAEVLL